MAIAKVILNGVTQMDVTQKTVTAGSMLSGTTALKNDGTDITGSIASQAAQTIHPSTTDQTIASGRYLTGAQTIKAVTTTNLTAANIVQGVTVKIGDSTDDDCVASVTGTAETGGNDFIITLTKNASTGIWEPDCTYAEAQAAYDGGKNVAFEASLSGSQIPCGEDSRTSNKIKYFVFEPVVTSNDFVFNYLDYTWDSIGINDTNAYPYYDTNSATAVPADVASGKVFYNADGYQVGTASGSGNVPTLLHSENVEISYSSTSKGSVATLNVGAEAFGNHIVYIRIRDTMGKRQGYFYGSDTYIYSMGAINNLPSVTQAAQKIYVGWRGSSSTLLTGTTSTGSDFYYGIYGYNVTNEGVLTLYAQYQSSYSGTINSTYKVDVYLLPYPGGAFA